jgi:hypothetical protein
MDILTPFSSLFPRPIVNLVGGLFWILSDSNVSLEEQILPNAFIWRTISNLERKKEKTE